MQDSGAFPILFTLANTLFKKPPPQKQGERRAAVNSLTLSSGVPVIPMVDLVTLLRDARYGEARHGIPRLLSPQRGAYLQSQVHGRASIFCGGSIFLFGNERGNENTPQYGKKSVPSVTAK